MMQSTIDKYSHLLNPQVPDPEEHDYWQAAAEFTNACAFEENETYKLVAKDGPDACWHPEQGVVCDKVCNKHNGAIYDLVVNAGTASQQPGFNATGGHVDANQMVNAYDPALVSTAPPMENAGGQWPPYPGDEHFDVIGQALFDDWAEAKRTPDSRMMRWQGRCDYDFLTGICSSNTDAVNKHRPDWRKELGLPPKASSQG